MRPTQAFRSTTSTTVAAMLCAAISLHAAQSASTTKDDPIIGTWQLNVTKSNYVPGPGPVSETRTYKRGPNGVEGAIERRFADGRSERIEYVAEFDRVYPVSGTDAYDHILLKRLDERTAQAVLSHAGRVYGVARRVVAPSGTRMTITLNRETSSGSKVINTAVYEKIAP